MIAVVDYGMGNLRSVQKALEAGGAKPKITSNPRDIERATALVVPGVGAFAHAMKELKDRKLTGVLSAKIRSGTPTLGICLGLQILFSESEEGGRTKGLGLVPGRVKRFRVSEKVPHIGWNTVSVKKRGCPLLEDMKNGEYFYFVHSYYAEPEDKAWTLAETPYKNPFCSAIWKGNLFATQFHPEKSQAAGLKLIGNFLKKAA